MVKIVTKVLGQTNQEPSFTQEIYLETPFCFNSKVHVSPFDLTVLKVYERLSLRFFTGIENPNYTRCKG